MIKAAQFTTHFCADPNCGLHVTGQDEDGKPICEIVMSREVTLAIMDICKKHLQQEGTLQ